MKTGRSFLSTIKSLSKAKFLALGFVAFAIAVTAPASAFAASTPTLTASPVAASASAYGTAGEVTPLGMVPNRYQCSQWTKLCVQINGAHVSGLPNACRMVWEWYGSGMHESGCTPGWWW